MTEIVLKAFELEGSTENKNTYTAAHKYVETWIWLSM